MRKVPYRIIDGCKKTKTELTSVIETICFFLERSQPVWSLFHYYVSSKFPVYLTTIKMNSLTKSKDSGTLHYLDELSNFMRTPFNHDSTDVT